MPTIFHWPGKLREGVVSDELIISTDIFPTIMDLLDIPYEDEIEGESLLGHLQNGDKINRETFYWHYPHYHKTNPGSVIRDAEFKLELYNLKNDLSETQNLADSLPVKRDALMEKLQEWLKMTNAKMPRPNPDYGEEKDQY